MCRWEMCMSTKFNRRSMSIWYEFFVFFQFILISCADLYPLKIGEILTKTIVVQEETENFIYFQTKVTSGNAFKFLSQPESCETTTYARHKQAPTHNAYDYKNSQETERATNTTIRVVSPLRGDWFFGVSSRTNCTIRVNILLEKYCPHDCFGHGTCHSNGTCSCEAEYKGLDCSQRIVSIPLDISKEYTVEENAFTYLVTETESKFLDVDIKSEDKPLLSDKGDVFIGKKLLMPTHHNYTYKMNPIDDRWRCYFVSSENNIWNIGVWGRKNFTFRLTTSSKVKCPNGCSRNGKCVDGVCQCNNNYFLSDCSKCMLLCYSRSILLNTH